MNKALKEIFKQKRRQTEYQCRIIWIMDSNLPKKSPSVLHGQTVSSSHFWRFPPRCPVQYSCRKKSSCRSTRQTGESDAPLLNGIPSTCPLGWVGKMAPSRFGVKMTACCAKRKWCTSQKQPASCSALTAIEWSLVTKQIQSLKNGKQMGVIGVWKTNRGLSPICQYQREGAITHILFCGLAYEEESMEKWNSLFFFATDAGSLCLGDDMKHCSEVCKVSGRIKSLLFYEKESSTIIITSHMLLVQFKLTTSEKLTPSRKFKLSIAGDPELLQAIWAGNGLIAISSGENMIRLMNIEKDENYVLTLADPIFGGVLLNDKILSIAYNNKKRSLACGTKSGNIVMWQCKSVSGEPPASSEGWEAKKQTKAELSDIYELLWGTSHGLICGLVPQGLVLLIETQLKKKMRDSLQVIQTNQKSLDVRMQGKNQGAQIKLDFAVKGVDCSQKHVLVWSGKEAHVFEITSSGAKPEGSFECKSMLLAILEDNVVSCAEGKIYVVNYKGVVKQMFNMIESEGDATLVELNSKRMIVATSNNQIKIWDVTRKLWKQMGMPRPFEKDGRGLGEIKQIAVNCDGTKLAILADAMPVPSIKVPDTKFYVYDIEYDSIIEYEISKHRIPVYCTWDQSDPRLLGVETEYVVETKEDEGDILEQDAIQPEAVEKPKVENEDKCYKMLTTFFVTSENGIKEHAKIEYQSADHTLLGINVPFYYICGYIKEETEESKYEESVQLTITIQERRFAEYEALREEIDEETKKAILNFSASLANGNMDEAYNAVRGINNTRVWESLAQLCIKTKRLDVAQICLGNMRFARGAKALRDAENEKEVEAKIATVAIHLNKTEMAKKLYEECGRFDLLIKLLEANGEWEEAIKVAEKNDKIHLNSLYYKIAKSYEYSGELDTSIKYYELSGIGKTEIPRMLWSHGKLDKLEEYIKKKRDPQLYRWWAQYLESKGNTDEAVKFYKLSNDDASLARIACIRDDLTMASKIALDSSDPYAAYHVARKYEASGHIQEAIKFYTKSQRLHHAIRLAKATGMDSEVFNLSLLSSKTIILQSAAYFEEKRQFEKAATLYDKGGNTRKALKIAEEHKLFELLKTLSKNLEDTEDPEMLAKNAQFLVDNGQYEKAVHLLLTAKRYEEAVDLCERNNVPMSEELANKVITQAGSGVGSEEAKRRDDIVTRVARLCKRQGLFAVACQKYTQIGKKAKAMKCLIKQGNVGAVIAYANTARDPEVYVMAANYLQNANLHNNDVKIMTTIVLFYKRAKAFENLAAFYEGQAQNEIDEYREYEKALGAMTEAVKAIQNAPNAVKSGRLQQLEYRMKLISDFVRARKLAETGTNPEEMVKICRFIMDSPDAESAVRVGDVIAQVIEYFYRIKDFKSAYEYLQSMVSRGIRVNPYLDQVVIENIYAALGIARTDVGGGQEGIAEEIGEEFEDNQQLQQLNHFIGSRYASISYFNRQRQQQQAVRQTNENILEELDTLLQKVVDGPNPLLPSLLKRYFTKICFIVDLPQNVVYAVHYLTSARCRPYICLGHQTFPLS
eukprot:TRINITY_DN1578_c0_g1_i1.p1 TRINITY_DN1578_c0_g1~~TRINITY_DN1578_c0_g1_i1.p1  ORF type:complete len:1534 (-),score=207.16 TRINITY_DN1578_c0_g1_i1:2494-7095(-)